MDDFSKPAVVHFMSYLLIKLNRLSAWLLLGLVVIYFLTGFDEVQNFWQADTSRYLHARILPLPTLILLFIHSIIGLRLFLIRRSLEDPFLKKIFYGAAILIFSLLFYLFFR
jgi:hypothetical protein